jgi:hypothetical protein
VYKFQSLSPIPPTPFPHFVEKGGVRLAARKAGRTAQKAKHAHEDSYALLGQKLKACVDVGINITNYVKVGGVGEIDAAMGENAPRLYRSDPPSGEFCGANDGGWPVERRRVGRNAAGKQERSAAARNSRLLQ